jgi:hypothetical protein
MQQTDPHIMDYVLGIITAAAVIIGFLMVLHGWLREQWWKLIDWWHEAPAYQEATEPEPDRSPQVNHAEPERTLGSGSAELALNADELAAVKRMIKHNAAARSPSKSSTIAAGFSVSRGGSATYQRASVIYDALFGQPEPAIQFPDPENGGRVPASYPVSGRRT